MKGNGKGKQCVVFLQAILGLFGREFLIPSNQSDVWYAKTN
jgi:hypothetical protein